MPKNKILAKFAYMESFYAMKQKRKCTNDTKQKIGLISPKLLGAKNQDFGRTAF